MDINGWSSQANTDYYELFGVDKEKEALGGGKPLVRSTWQPTHRLHAFYWDEACEYPLPAPNQQLLGDEEDEDTKAHTDAIDYDDECIIPLFQNLVEQLKELSVTYDRQI